MRSWLREEIIVAPTVEMLWKTKSTDLIMVGLISHGQVAAMFVIAGFLKLKKSKSWYLGIRNGAPF